RTPWPAYRAAERPVGSVPAFGRKHQPRLPRAWGRHADTARAARVGAEGRARFSENRPLTRADGPSWIGGPPTRPLRTLKDCAFAPRRLYTVHCPAWKVACDANSVLGNSWLDRKTRSEHAALWGEHLVRRSSIVEWNAPGSGLRHRSPRPGTGAHQERTAPGQRPHADRPYPLGSHSGLSLFRTAFCSR